MEFGLMVDMSFCGSDCRNDLNNPVNSAFRIIDSDMNIRKDILSYIIPNEQITFSAYSVHGISLADLKDMENAMSVEDYLKMAYSVLTKCRDKGFYLIGFNQISFDMEILNRHFQKILMADPIIWPNEKTIDIQSVVSKMTDFREIGSYNIDSCAAYMFKDDPRMFENIRFKYHNATNDIDTEFNLLKKIIGRLDVNLFSSIVEYVNSEEEFKVFSWGKYKGMRPEDIILEDQQYLNWCLKNSEVKSKHPGLIKKIRKLYSEAQ